MSRNHPGSVRVLGDYMTKVTLWRGLRLHIIWRPDLDQDCHDHPCDFWTFPLVSYWEQLPDRTFRYVRAFRLHRRRAEYAHRIHGPEIFGQMPIVTLVWWGRTRREWGFHTAEGWVPWRTYVERQT